ncbi:ABC transporter permease [Arcobacter sp. F2176]|uniref:ABC transporter permease n=1 Tax=Arcobacter sp. F2176 TaxID=2044511 RepID=UPI00100A7FA6|nr:ABC transporter permease [Arcobacter sp. F2176]RXJ81020.1 ABC transporter permease [Arcobacter sp. F2176]
MLNKINSSLIGYSILIVLFLFIIFIPLLTDIDPNKQNLMNALADFNSSNLLGTDQYGRDMLTRLAYATRLSFILAFITMLTAAIPGILLGIFAAYKEGIIEKILILISDIILSLPGLLLVLLLVAFDPGNLLLLYLGLSLSLWVEFFRVTRVKTKTILVQPYIESTKLLGFSTFYILKKQILPQLFPILFTLATFAMSTAIIAISTLSAMGIGLHPPRAELGGMIVEFMPYFDEKVTLILLPSFFIFLLILSLQLISKRRF